MASDAKRLPQPQLPHFQPPLHELWNTGVQVSGGFEVQELGSLVDVCAGQRDIAGLLGHLIDDCFFAKCVFDRGNHVVEVHGLGAAEVEDVALGRIGIVRPGEGTHDAVHDVADESVVTGGVALAILVDRLVLVDQAGELGNGQVGTLAGAIHGEEAQAHRADVVERGVVRAHLLAGHLRHGVGRDGLENGVHLRERHFLVHAIDRAAAGKDKALDPVALASLQHVEGALNVGINVEFWSLDAGTDPRTSGEVNDGIIATRGEGLLDESWIPQVSLMQGDAVTDGTNVFPLDGRIVVVVEAVENASLMALAEETFDSMGADESGTAGDEDFHAW